MRPEPVFAKVPDLCADAGLRVAGDLMDLVQRQPSTGVQGVVHPEDLSAEAVAVPGVVRRTLEPGHLEIVFDGELRYRSIPSMKINRG